MGNVLLALSDTDLLIILVQLVLLSKTSVLDVLIVALQFAQLVVPHIQEFSFRDKDALLILQTALTLLLPQVKSFEVKQV